MGVARGGAAAALRLRGPGWTCAWPFKAVPRSARPRWRPGSFLLSPGTQVQVRGAVGGRRARCPAPSQAPPPPAWPHGPGHREPLAPGQRPLLARGAPGESGLAWRGAAHALGRARGWGPGSPCCCLRCSRAARGSRGGASPGTPAALSALPPPAPIRANASLRTRPVPVPVAAPSSPPPCLPGWAWARASWHLRAEGAGVPGSITQLHSAAG